MKDCRRESSGRRARTICRGTSRSSPVPKLTLLAPPTVRLLTPHHRIKHNPLAMTHATTAITAILLAVSSIAVAPHAAAPTASGTGPATAQPSEDGRGVVTIAISNPVSDREIIDEVRTAAYYWHQRTGFQYRVVPATAAGPDALNVTLRESLDDCGGVSTPVACIRYSAGERLAASIVIRAGLEDEAVIHMVAHELGHALDHGHDTGPWPVMNRSLDAHYEVPPGLRPCLHAGSEEMAPDRRPEWNRSR